MVDEVIVEVKCPVGVAKIAVGKVKESRTESRTVAGSRVSDDEER